ncbi:MAG: class I SAM-dependent methyltransferase [Fimbriimonadaceae bacterium]|nr:class I SAM-dependent methyltransferase [Fimbriimonadaceae bacterium]
MHHRGAKDGVPLWGCDCGSLNAEVAPADLPRYSESYSGASFAPHPAVRQSLAETISSLAPYRQLGRWADLGFGEGALLSEAQAQGWSCAGTEISHAALEFGRSRQWEVRTSSQEWPTESFDVVSVLEVLEHVLAPEDLLREASRLLRPGGALVATTPNIESLNFRMLGIGWTVVAPPEHVTLFSLEGLGRLTRRIPLEVLSLRTSGLNPIEMMHRHRRGAAITAAQRNARAQHLMDATSMGQGRLIRRLLNSALDFLHAGDSLKLLAVKPGPGWELR